MDIQKYFYINENFIDKINTLHPSEVFLLRDNDSKHRSELSLDYYIQNKIQILE